MFAPSNASAVLDRIYLDVRCRLLDIAASLDRVERAEGSDDVKDDPRLKQLLDGVVILASGESDRAERIQMLFSDAYTPGWNKRANGKAETRG